MGQHVRELGHHQVQHATADTVATSSAATGQHQLQAAPPGPPLGQQVASGQQLQQLGLVQLDASSVDQVQRQQWQPDHHHASADQPQPDRQANTSGSGSTARRSAARRRRPAARPRKPRHAQHHGQQLGRLVPMGQWPARP